jgi:hypothetical protein
MRDVAGYYAQKYGATVLPVAGKEIPDTKHWFFFADKPMDQQPWESATGFAFICGKNGYRCIDVDGCPPERIEKVAGAILGHLQLPGNYPWLVITGTGFHLWFRTPDCTVTIHDVIEWKPWGVFENVFHHLELRYAHSYALVPPSRHPTGQRYAFINGTAPDHPPAEVSFDSLSNALGTVSYYDDGICGGCYQREEYCTCWEREERESEYGYW